MTFKKNTKDEEILTIIEQRGAARFEKIFPLCGGLLSFFEILLVFNLIFTKSGGNYKNFYFLLYIFIIFSCSFIFLILKTSKKQPIPKRTKIIYNLEILFMFTIEIWAFGITYVDTLSHHLMDLLVYISVLALVPSIIFVKPIIGVSLQLFLDLLVYIGIFILDPPRTKYLFINFSTFALVSLILYFITYKTQYELYEREAELKKAAEYDSLTQLKNRFSYSTYIQMLKDHPENREFAILLLDLNGLKITNDTKGHQIGDELLKAAATCIYKAFHKNGVCFRTGGDEFVVILNKRLDEIQPMLRTLESLCSNWKSENFDNLSISFGLAEALEEKELTVEQLIELADTRMYEMKNKYYNQQGIDRRKNQLTK